MGEVSDLLHAEIVLPNDTLLTNQYAGLGVTFSGVWFNGCTACVTTSPTGAKPDVTNFFATQTGMFTPQTILTFSPDLRGTCDQTA